MIHSLPPGQSYYRVTTIGRRWRDVLSGRGALYLAATGNRYNTVLQQANQAVTWPFAGHPPPHPGLRVPAVRSRHAAADPQVNYVLYRLPGTPLGQQEGRWRLRIEFLDLNGNPVGPGSPRID